MLTTAHCCIDDSVHGLHEAARFSDDRVDLCKSGRIPNSGTLDHELELLHEPRNGAQLTQEISFQVARGNLSKRKI